MVLLEKRLQMLKDNCNHFIVDPILNTNIAQLNEFKPDINFICLPTPENSDGTCNAEIVINVLQELKDKKFNSINVIKSTITPDVISDLSEIDKKFIYNPEFLTERNADFDFINSNLIVLGGNKEEQKLSQNFILSIQNAYKKIIFLHQGMKPLF